MYRNQFQIDVHFFLYLEPRWSTDFLKSSVCFVWKVVYTIFALGYRTTRFLNRHYFSICNKTVVHRQWSGVFQVFESTGLRVFRYDIFSVVLHDILGCKAFPPFLPARKSEHSCYQFSIHSAGGTLVVTRRHLCPNYVHTTCLITWDFFKNIFSFSYQTVTILNSQREIDIFHIFHSYVILYFYLEPYKKS